MTTNETKRSRGARGGLFALAGLVGASVMLTAVQTAGASETAPEVRLTTTGANDGDSNAAILQPAMSRPLNTPDVPPVGSPLGTADDPDAAGLSAILEPAIVRSKQESSVPTTFQAESAAAVAAAPARAAVVPVPAQAPEIEEETFAALPAIQPQRLWFGGTNRNQSTTSQVRNSDVTPGLGIHVPSINWPRQYRRSQIYNPAQRSILSWVRRPIVHNPRPVTRPGAWSGNWMAGLYIHLVNPIRFR